VAVIDDDSVNNVDDRDLQLTGYCLSHFYLL